MDNIIVSVITVTYNNENNIKEYLNALKKGIIPGTEVIIVDNLSTDKTVDILKQYKQYSVIESKENLGFAKACNLAAKKSRGKYLFFLNPDTKITKFILDKLVQFSELTNDAGIVAPKLVQYDGDIQPSVRKFPTLLGAIQEYYFGLKNSFEAYVPEGVDAIRVDTVVGAAMFMKKEVFEKVGGFNENYFMYYEDLEICKRVKQLGLGVYYLPDVIVYHKVGESISANKLLWLKRSARIYHGFFQEICLHIILKFRHLLGRVH